MSGTKFARCLVNLKDALQKMQLRLWSRQIGFVAPKCHMVEILHKIDRHRPKICLDPNFHGYSNSPWHETNMHTWIYGKNHFCEKVLAFLKITTGWAKNKKTLDFNNRFCVPTTFELTDLLLKTFHLRIHSYTLTIGYYNLRSQIYMDLNYIDPQTRVLNYCFKL